MRKNCGINSVSHLFSFCFWFRCGTFWNFENSHNEAFERIVAGGPFGFTGRTCSPHQCPLSHGKFPCFLLLPTKNTHIVTKLNTGRPIPSRCHGRMGKSRRPNTQSRCLSQRRSSFPQCLFLNTGKPFLAPLHNNTKQNKKQSTVQTCTPARGSPFLISHLSPSHKYSSIQRLS